MSIVQGSMRKRKVSPVDVWSAALVIPRADNRDAIPACAKSPAVEAINALRFSCVIYLAISSFKGKGNKRIFLHGKAVVSRS